MRKFLSTSRLLGSAGMLLLVGVLALALGGCSRHVSLGYYGGSGYYGDYAPYSYYNTSPAYPGPYYQPYYYYNTTPRFYGGDRDDWFEGGSHWHGGHSFGRGFGEHHEFGEHHGGHHD